MSPSPRVILALITTVLSTFVTGESNSDPKTELMSQGVGDYPYLVAICQKFPNGTVQICAGTLIKPEWVLTSESCRIEHNPDVGKKKTLEFVAASVFNLKTLTAAPIRHVKSWISHPEFGKNNYSLTNDLALLHLVSSFLPNLNMAPITLPPRAILNDDDLHTKFTNCSFIFWRIKKTHQRMIPRVIWLTNETTNTELHEMMVQPISRQECKKVLAGQSVVLTYGQVCAKVLGDVLCAEHTGGPLVCEGVQFGVYSWQKPDQDGRLVPVFTRVDVFEKYITGTVSDLKLATKFRFRHLKKKTRHSVVYERTVPEGSFQLKSSFLITYATLVLLMF